MNKSFKARLARLEALEAPPEPTWAIGVEWIVGWGTPSARVVAKTPARLIEPGQPFNYQLVIDDITRAHALMPDIDESQFWGDTELLEEDGDTEL